MTTQAELMKIVAKEGGPESAALLASVFEQQVRDREAAAPTWEMVIQARTEGYDRGLADGKRDARATVIARILGDINDDD